MMSRKTKRKADAMLAIKRIGKRVLQFTIAMVGAIIVNTITTELNEPLLNRGFYSGAVFMAIVYNLESILINKNK